MMSTRSLRILFVNDMAYVVETLRPELAREGLSSTLIGARPGEPSASRHLFLRNSGEIVSKWKSFSACDIVHVNYGLYGYLLLGTRKPAVLHLHGSDIRPNRALRYHFANLVSQLGSQIADRVWYSTTDILPYLGGINTPHRFMPNPVSSRFFATNAALPATPHVLFAVPLSGLKGADVAVRAMALLTQRYPSLRISSFAFGPNEADASRYAASIPKSVERLSWTPREAVPQLLEQATVVVGRFSLGSLGVMELEAMASGRPLICQLNAPLRMSDPYYTEEPPLVSCSDAESVCQAIGEILEDQSWAARMAREAREWVHRFHSARAVASLYSKEYSAIAAG